MSDEQDKARDTAERILKFAEELEAHGDVTMAGTPLERARAILHQWVDSATAIVSVPAFGRVTLIHADGRESSISSSDLPFKISVPVGWKKES